MSGLHPHFELRFGVNAPALIKFLDKSVLAGDLSNSAAPVPNLDYRAPQKLHSSHSTICLYCSLELADLSSWSISSGIITEDGRSRFPGNGLNEI